jgi:hypothetical protein
MQFETFCLLARSSPITIRELLALAGYDPTNAAVSSLMECYKAIDENLPFSADALITGNYERMSEFANAHSLNSGTVTIAVAIYELYCHLLSKGRENLSSILSEEYIRFRLTGGTRNLDYCVLWDGSIVHWDPDNMVLGFSIGDDEMYGECFEYLTRLNRSFATLDDLVEYAKICGWPNWNKIKQRYYNPWN